VSHGAEPRKRTRDPEGKRAAILAAARAVFAENGYEKATIREIARRAGVTHGLVVLHFTSKEKLFLAAVPGASILAASEAGDLNRYVLADGPLAAMPADELIDRLARTLRAILFD